METGQIIKQQRKEKQLSQEVLAEKVGVTRQLISKWEKGLSIPNAEQIQKLSEVLDISIAEFLPATQNTFQNDNSKNSQQSNNSDNLYLQYLIIAILFVGSFQMFPFSIIASSFNLIFSWKTKQNPVILIATLFVAMWTYALVIYYYV